MLVQTKGRTAYSTPPQRLQTFVAESQGVEVTETKARNTS